MLPAPPVTTHTLPFMIPIFLASLAVLVDYE